MIVPPLNPRLAPLLTSTVPPVSRVPPRVNVLPLSSATLLPLLAPLAGRPRPLGSIR